jgi:hypothetical protein
MTTCCYDNISSRLTWSQHCPWADLEPVELKLALAVDVPYQRSVVHAGAVTDAD